MSANPPKFCVICGGSADESHHIHPQHLGGAASSAQVYLCGTHHAKIHHVAQRLAKGKPVDEPPEFMQRAGPLIKRIVRAMVAARTENLDHVPSRLIIKVPKAKLRQIHRRKIDLGFPSLEAYVLSLIERDLPK